MKFTEINLLYFYTYNKKYTERKKQMKNNIYLCGASIEKEEDLADILNNGLISYYGTSIQFTMRQLTEDELKKYDLGTLMKNYYPSKYNTVFLIKIPKEYMPDNINSLQSNQPIPVFKQEGSRDNYGRKIIRFTPHLIQGFYSQEKNTFITNPNFSPIFDPSGLVYSNEQVNNFEALGASSYQEEAYHRTKMSYQQLKLYDQKTGIFQQAMKKYSEKLISKCDLSEHNTLTKKSKILKP